MDDEEPSEMAKPTRQFGDFQTPPALVRQVLKALGPIAPTWPRVLEPTCGQGNFLRELAACQPPPADVVGLELQPDYCRQARQIAAPPGASLRVIQADLFRFDLRELSWQAEGPLLVVGNPPWVTSAELGALGAGNVPQKSNLKRLAGLDAKTGRSNFDLAEYIWLKLLSELAGEQATIALLCKTAVARKVLAHAWQHDLPLLRAEIRRLPAREWFGAAVDACLFRVDLGPGVRAKEATVFATLQCATPERTMGWRNGQLIADAERYQRVHRLDGRFPCVWRQGIKHDAAAVMELAWQEGCWRNGWGEAVDVEDDYLFPLLKTADLRSQNRSAGLRRSVIVTQRTIGAETATLEQEAPRLWAYLVRHRQRLDRRKSSIYKNRPPFSMFGVGPYTFAPHKVMISAFAHPPRFLPVGPQEGRPVLCDDTCYLLPCEDAAAASVLAAVLNQPCVKDFFAAISFRDSKRSITKELLQRLDLAALLAAVDRDRVLQTAGEDGFRTLAASQMPSPAELLSQFERFKQACQPSPVHEPDLFEHPASG